MQCNVELIACGREMQADVTGGGTRRGGLGLAPPSSYAPAFPAFKMWF